MRLSLRRILIGCLITCSAQIAAAAQNANDGLYREIIRTVVEADFDGMAATYHPDAVLVSRDRTKLISEQLSRWREDGEQFARRGGRATLAFRFSSRVVGDASAFDTGIFRYARITADGEESVSYVFFENLTVKLTGSTGDNSDGNDSSRWLTLMERQKESATEADWLALPGWK